MAQNPLKWPIVCIAGIAVIVTYCIFTFMSLALFPGSYSPLYNWLSDLGNSSYNPDGAVFYNAGCILAGIALFPFYAGIAKWYTNERWRKCLLATTQLTGLFSALALMMVGIFSEDYPGLHGFWSSVFFILNLAVLSLLTTSLITHPNFIKPIGYYGYAVAAINMILVTIGTTPLIEWITVFTALGYVGLIVHNTFRLAFILKKT